MDPVAGELCRVEPLLCRLTKYWWLVALRGALSILFGILALAVPVVALGVLIWVLAAYMLVDGCIALASAIGGMRANAEWGWLLVEGIVGVVAGVTAFLMPGLAAFGILALIAAWAVVTGVFEIAAAIKLRREIQGELLLVLGGVASVALGVLLVLFPVAGLITGALLIGVYAIVFGALVLGLGVRLRQMAQRLPAAPAGRLQPHPVQPIARADEGVELPIEEKSQVPRDSSWK